MLAPDYGIREKVAKVAECKWFQDKGEVNAD
jgi:hypothetical protein